MIIYTYKVSETYSINHTVYANSLEDANRQVKQFSESLDDVRTYLTSTTIELLREETQ